MRPPPKSLEDLLYQSLLNSKHFNNFVRRIHAKINKIPYYEPNSIYNHENMKLVHNYKPTTIHKINAFRIIWWDEMKRSFLFKLLV